MATWEPTKGTGRKKTRTRRSTCPPGMKRDPKTGRCVRSTSKK